MCGRGNRIEDPDADTEAEQVQEKGLYSINVQMTKTNGQKGNPNDQTNPEQGRSKHR